MLGTEYSPCRAKLMLKCNKELPWTETEERSEQRVLGYVAAPPTNPCLGPGTACFMVHARSAPLSRLLVSLQRFFLASVCTRVPSVSRV